MAVCIEMVQDFRGHQDADVCICVFGDVGNKVASDPDFDAVRTRKVYKVVNRLDHGSEKLCPEAVGNDAFHKGDPHMAKGVVVGSRWCHVAGLACDRMRASSRSVASGW